MSDSELKQAFADIEVYVAEIAAAERAITRTLEKVRSQILGRRIDCHRTGNLRGIYEICHVAVGYAGTIQASGRKVLSNGKLGTQTWDLGEINARRLGL